MNRNELQEIVCVDLDGTIADYRTRKHLSPVDGSSREEWKEFHAACGSDEPFAGVALLLRSLYATHQIHYVSGRFDTMKVATQAWLHKHDLPYDVIRLYGSSDAPAKNGEFKARYIKSLQAHGLRPVLFIEDLPHVAEYIEVHTSVPVMCINPGYEDIA